MEKLRTVEEKDVVRVWIEKQVGGGVKVNK